jgi:hypothetical protein
VKKSKPQHNGLRDQAEPTCQTAFPIALKPLST